MQSRTGQMHVTGGDVDKSNGKLQTGKSSVVDLVELTVEEELLNDLSKHFARYCRKNGINPVPKLYTLVW
eukprot:g7162.t1